MQALTAKLPECAEDLRLNLSSIARIESLSEQQLWGTALATAIACRNPDVVAAVAEEAREHLSEAAFGSARTAASVMAMNNVYYRFVHLASNAEYGRMPARLRMQALASRGVDAVDFELWCLAVSAVNGCGTCVDAHERKLREAGVAALAVQDAARIAAILHGVATVLDTEATLAPRAV